MKSMLKKIHPLALIIFGALVLRLISINQSLWLDEAISATVVKNYSYTYIWNNFILADTHPPLYYIVLKAWTDIFGYSEVSLRMPSILMGVATVYVIYLVSWKIFSEKTGLIASVLMATSGLHIYYSQEARMYGMTTLLAALAVYLYLTKKWLFLAMILVILAMTDYLPMTIVLALLGLSLFFKRYRSTIIPFTGSMIPSLLFYVYFVKTLFFQSASTLSYLNANTWWGSVLGTGSLKDVALVWVKFILGRVGFDNQPFYILVVVVVSLVFGFAIISALKSAKKSVLLWLWLVVPILFSLLMSLKVPGFSYFRLIFVIPAFYILVAVGISNTKWKKLSLGAVVSVNLIFALLYLGDERYHREDWKSLVPFVENKLGATEVVFVSFSEPFTPYLWYSTKKDQIMPFSAAIAGTKTGVYTLDYLMDLTDPERKNYETLRNLGFSEANIYNFRGTGQVRYWKKI